MFPKPPAIMNFSKPPDKLINGIVQLAHNKEILF